MGEVGRHCLWRGTTGTAETTLDRGRIGSEIGPSATGTGLVSAKVQTAVLKICMTATAANGESQIAGAVESPHTATVVTLRQADIASTEQVRSVHFAFSC